MSYLDRMSMLEGQVGRLEDARMQEARENDRLRSEVKRLQSEVDRLRSALFYIEQMTHDGATHEHVRKVLGLPLLPNLHAQS